MAVAVRLVAGVIAVVAALGATAAGNISSAQAAISTPRQTATVARDLRVDITRVGNGSIRPDRKLVVRGTVTNVGATTWLDAQAYLMMTPVPATTLADLRYFASVPNDPGLGNTIYTYGLFDQLGDLHPGRVRGFRLAIPYDALGITGTAGVYRVGVKVLAGTAAGRNLGDAAYTSTLMPLLPSGGVSDPAEALTLLPLSAPVKRLGEGVFADDSLRRLIAPQGRLSNILDWLNLAPPGTVQIAIDPSLLNAITDMSSGYRVEARPPATGTVPGKGTADAQVWLQKFQLIKDAQYVLYLPWGTPAVNSLLGHHLPGPVLASIDASQAYRQSHPSVAGVAGWLANGSSGIRAVTVLHHVGADLQIVSQTSLPGFASYAAEGRYVPGHVVITNGGRHIHTLVSSPTVAGVLTRSETSPLQFRQRLIADATVRSLSGHAGALEVSALPFTWDPGPVRPSEGLSRAFSLGVVVPQSAIGALDRPGTPYRGAVRPSIPSFRALSPHVIEAIHHLRVTGGRLAAIVRPAVVAEREYQRVFAMSGSNQWATFPATGAALIKAKANADHAALAKVSVTGPPFVAMSSNSGRFPLTVTNGLARPITVTIAVRPANPALSIAPIGAIQLPPGERRDVQVQTTAAGSGVTSVRARLATPGVDGHTGSSFGKPWRFDVRSTQIGLVIWIVMAIGGIILFGAAGYRIVNRLRGKGGPRRQAVA